MAILHRALFTWFNLLIFMILLALRLDQKIQWNWFIVFIPMWIYCNFLFLYVIFTVISHCKNGLVNSLHRKIWYTATVVMILIAEFLICLKLEVSVNLSAKAVLAPLWLLLPALTIDVFIHLIQYSSY